MLRNERFQKDVEYHIGKIVEQEGLPDSIETLAISIYDQFHEPRYAKSRPAIIYALACVHFAAQVEDEPVSIRALAADHAPLVDDAAYQIGRAKKTIAHKTGIETLPQSPEVYLDSFIEDGWLDEDLSERAVEIINSTSIGNGGRSPISIAAGAVYTAAKLSGIKLTQKRIHELSGVSPNTLRGVYEDAMEDLDL